MAKLEPYKVKANVDALRKNGVSDEEIRQYLEEEGYLSSGNAPSSLRQAAADIQGFGSESKVDKFAKENALPIIGDIALAGAASAALPEVAAGGALGLALKGARTLGVGASGGVGAGIGQYATDTVDGMDENTKLSRAKEALQLGTAFNVGGSAVAGALKAGDKFLERGAKTAVAQKTLSSLKDSLVGLKENASKVKDSFKEASINIAEKGKKLDKEYIGGQDAVMDIKDKISFAKDSVSEIKNKAFDVTQQIKERTAESGIIQGLKRKNERMMDSAINKGKIIESTVNDIKSQWIDAIDSAKQTKYGKGAAEYADSSIDKMSNLLESFSGLKQSAVDKISYATKIARNEFSKSYDDFFENAADKNQTINVGDELAGLANLADEAFNKSTESNLKSVSKSASTGKAVDITQETKDLLEYSYKAKQNPEQYIIEDLKANGFNDNQIQSFLNGGAVEIPLQDAHRIKQAINSSASKIFRSGNAEEKNIIGNGLNMLSDSLIDKIDAASGAPGVYKKMSTNWKDLLATEEIANSYIGRYGAGEFANSRINSPEVVSAILKKESDPLGKFDQIAGGKIQAYKQQLSLLRQSGSEKLIQEADDIEKAVGDVLDNFRSRDAIDKNLSSLINVADEATKKELLQLRSSLRASEVEEQGAKGVIAGLQSEIQSVKKGMKSIKDKGVSLDDLKTTLKKDEYMALKKNAKEQRKVSRDIKRYEDTLPKPVDAEEWGRQHVRLAIATALPSGPLATAYRGYAGLAFLRRAGANMVSEAGLKYVESIKKPVLRLIDMEMGKKMSEEQLKILKLAKESVKRDFYDDQLIAPTENVNDDEYLRSFR